MNKAQENSQKSKKPTMAELTKTCENLFKKAAEDSAVIDNLANDNLSFKQKNIELIKVSSSLLDDNMVLKQKNIKLTKVGASLVDDIKNKDRKFKVLDKSLDEHIKENKKMGESYTDLLKKYTEATKNYAKIVKNYQTVVSNNSKDFAVLKQRCKDARHWMWMWFICWSILAVATIYSVFI